MKNNVTYSYKKSIGTLTALLKEHFFVAITVFGIFLIFFGYALGRLSGSAMLEGVITRGLRFPLLVARPVGEFFTTYQLVYSENPLYRLSGYYSLADNNLIDEEFLIERFKEEKEIYNKRTIVWLLSFSENHDMVMDFYGKVFADSSGGLRMEILRSIKRIDEKYLYRFAREKGIPVKILDNL